MWNEGTGGVTVAWEVMITAGVSDQVQAEVMMNRRAGRLGGTVLPLVVSSVLAFAGCGKGEDARPATTQSAAQVGPVPFALATTPDGYVVRDALDGGAEPLWSSDSLGGVHPTVILVPGDWRGTEDARWVVIESYDGSDNEGGARQELPTYLNIGAERHLTIGGHPAVMANQAQQFPGSDQAMTHAYVAVDTNASARGTFGSGATGFVVSGPGATTAAALMPIASAVTTAMPHKPVVITPPERWRVLASLDAEQVDPFLGDIRLVPRARRVLVLAPPSGKADDEVTLTALRGSDETAQALAIAVGWHARVPGEPATIADHEQGGRRWTTILSGGNRIALTTIGAAPFAVTGSATRIQDDAWIAALLTSVQITDEHSWTALTNPK